MTWAILYQYHLYSQFYPIIPRGISFIVSHITLVKYLVFSTSKIYICCKKTKTKKKKYKNTDIIYLSTPSIVRGFWKQMKRSTPLTANMITVFLRAFGIVMFVHTLMLSDQHLSWHHRLYLASTISWIKIFQRQSSNVTWSNHIIYQGLIMKRKDCYWPIRLSTLFPRYDFVLPVRDAEHDSHAFFLECLDDVPCQKRHGLKADVALPYPF